ncbi:hypothetical protein CBR_g8946 [Chara braunii]|uniref:Reverse transcriptase domain-containing protein n=1 Tax=Chara braunii TaxID=69332 RepID=A0A388KNE8_CHABU|nr:hypothetical protein CBR_g8946 [Chara braunii]|eukprot:GBG71528.1 hypothetical protein CBR_g8946 [Chara braunii]
MTTEFRDLLDRSVLIYLDDILVYSRTLDEHIVHLRVVLNRLRLAKYKANLDKCEFARQELEYLGHFVTPKGIRPLADKIQAIVDWPEPRSTTDVRSFMGLAGYYQRFVESYSKVAAPLSRLQSPKVPFEFNDAARGAFTTLKAAMQAAPALRIYDPTLPTQVTTDASGYGIGAVLEQCHEDGWHPVEYFSQKVPLVNTLDDARKKELLAFVTVLKRWRHFLLDCRRFKWNTDNNPLTFYKTQHTVTSTIGRWMYYIDQFDFDPCHIPGPANRAADALSRRPDFCAIVTTAFDLDDDLQQHFVKGYKSDPTYSTLYAELSSDQPPASHYRISDGFLLLHTRGKDLLVVPQDRILRTRLLGEFHDARLSAHLGVNCTLARLRRRFHWPDVLHDVTRYIESCAVCHRNKGRSRVPFGELKPLPIPRAPRLSIAMDVTGPFPRDRHGHYGILTVVDRLIRRVPPPRISVIIPVYNAGSDLPATVESVMNQTSKDWEIIMVDDGSTDNSRQVMDKLVRQYAHAHNREFRIVEKRNGGLADARNAGIAVARAKWVFPLDADDLIKPDFFEKALAIIDSDDDVNLVIADLKGFGEWEYSWRLPEYNPEDLRYTNMFHCSAVFKKSLWSTVGGYPTTTLFGYEDWAFWIAAEEEVGIEPRYIREDLFLYRMSHNSMHQTLLSYQEFSMASLRMLYPALFPLELILAAHEKFFDPPERVMRLINDKVTKFPSHHIPYLMRGLAREAKAKDDASYDGSHLEDALDDYKKAVKFSPYDEWQPKWRLGLLLLQMGKTSQGFSMLQTLLKDFENLEIFYEMMVTRALRSSTYRASKSGHSVWSGSEEDEEESLLEVRQEL